MIECKCTLEQTVTSLHASQVELLDKLELASNKISAASSELTTLHEEKATLKKMVATHEERGRLLQETIEDKDTELSKLVDNLKLLHAYYQLPTAYCQLLTTNCPLLTAVSLLQRN